MKLWTNTDIDFLINNLTLTDKELAERLGRSKYSVKRKRSHYGLVKDVESRRNGVYRHPDGLREKVLSMSSEMSSRLIAETLGLSVRAVDRILYRNKIRGRKRNVSVNGKNRMIWSKLAKIETRDGKRCVICGYSTCTDVHHIDHNNRNNDLSNLITLCPNCHREAHAGLITFWVNWKATTLTPRRVEEKQAA